MNQEIRITFTYISNNIHIHICMLFIKNVLCNLHAGNSFKHL